MKSSVLLTLCVALSVGANAASVTPVEKVLEMLHEMKAKGEAGLDAEQKIYREYAEWVDDQRAQLGFDIKTAKTTIEEMLACIAKADNTARQLGEEIKVLDGETAELEANIKKTNEEAATEQAEFDVKEQDLSESVDALQRAISVMKAQAYDRPQALLQLQKMAQTMPGMPRVLAAFLQETSVQPGAPEVAAYDFESGGIITLLEKLLDKFSDELSDAQKAHANTQHAFNLLRIDYTDNLKWRKGKREEKLAGKARATAESASCKGELADAKAELAADEKTLKDTNAVFAEKSATYEANQKVRKDELEALNKAIEIIASPSVAESYSTHIKLVQEGATSLLQMSSARSRVTARDRVSRFLRRRATVLQSRELAEFAALVEANPFKKVTGMIKTLIAKLKEEAQAEATHKAWCDEQLKANKLKREKKQAQSDKLMAEIENLAAQIDTMGKEIAKLIEEQAQLTAAMKKATEIRTAEKAENLKTIADSKAGAEAVKAALAILREFYSSQAALLQRQVPEMEEYKGMQGAKGGIIGMLEVIQTDFEREAAETTAAEAEAAREYKTFMTDSARSKKAKHEAEFKLKMKKDQAEFDKSEKEKDLAAVTEELDRANTYFEYLKPNCLVVHVSYEERVQKRKEEIEALKQAYEILDAK